MMPVPLETAIWLERSREFARVLGALAGVLEC